MKEEKLFDKEHADFVNSQISFQEVQKEFGATSYEDEHEWIKSFINKHYIPRSKLMEIDFDYISREANEWVAHKSGIMGSKGKTVRVKNFIDLLDL